MRLFHFLKTPSPTSAALTARLAGFGVFQKQLRRTSPFYVATTAHLLSPLKIPPPPHLRLTAQLRWFHHFSEATPVPVFASPNYDLTPVLLLKNTFTSFHRTYSAACWFRRLAEAATAHVSVPTSSKH
jgi:hypothetical protein